MSSVESSLSASPVLPHIRIQALGDWCRGRGAACMPYWKAGVWGPALFFIPASCQCVPWETLVMAQELGSLPPKWEAWTRFLAPGFSPSPGPLYISGDWTSRWRYLSASLCLFAFQINETCVFVCVYVYEQKRRGHTSLTGWHFSFFWR